MGSWLMPNFSSLPSTSLYCFPYQIAAKSGSGQTLPSQSSAQLPTSARYLVSTTSSSEHRLGAARRASACLQSSEMLFSARAASARPMGTQHLLKNPKYARDCLLFQFNFCFIPPKYPRKKGHPIFSHEIAVAILGVTILHVFGHRAKSHPGGENTFQVESTVQVM